MVPNPALWEPGFKIALNLRPVDCNAKNTKKFCLFFLDNKIHTVLVYKYIRGITLKDVDINSEISAEFGSYVGRLTLILKVIIFIISNKYFVQFKIN